MQVQKVTLNAGTIIQLDAGEHPVVVVGNRVFIEFMALPELTAASSPAPAPTSPKADPEVADDKAPKTRKKKEEAAPVVKDTPPPVTEPDGFGEGEDVPESDTEGGQAASTVGALVAPKDYASLMPGTKVWAKLNLEGPDGEKYWETQVEKYAKGILTLFFFEDETTLELTPSDEVYAHLA